MRVTNSMIFGSPQTEISRITEKIYQYQKNIASAKRINKPSDDPTGMRMVLNHRTSKSQITQYQRNIDQADSWLLLGDGALSEIESALERAVEVAMTQASDTYSASERTSAALEVESIFDQIMQSANTKIGDRSIFAGTRTDSTPFTRDQDFNITYNGDDNSIDLNVSQQVTVAINISGQEVFIDSNLFGTLKDLRDSLLSNDRDGISQQLSSLDSVLASVRESQSKVGAITNRVDSMSVQLDNLDLRVTELMSNLEDTDMFEAITELTNQQTVYEATLRSIALVSDLSLAKLL